MSTILVSMFLTIVVLIAFITNGLLERIFWITGAILVGVLFKEYKQISKWNYWRNTFKGMILGYIVVMLLLMNLQHPIEEIYVGKNYVPTNKSAIVLIFSGEPSTYDISLASRNYTNNMKLWEILWMPLKLFREKISYEKANTQWEEYFSSRLKRLMEEELGDKYNVYNAYVSKTPYLQETMNRIIRDGNQKIIFCPMFLTESTDYINLQEEIKRINLQQYRTEVYITQPLWNSDTIARSFASEINKSKASEHKYNIGILLVGEEITKSNYNFPYIKQDLLFREKVKDLLVRDGYNNNKIRLTAFNKRNVKDEIEKLMEYGVAEIILVPSTTSLHSIANQLKMEKIIKSIETPYTVEVYSLNPWIYNDDIARELLNRIQLLNL
ncbi:ferrochelatase [Natronincola peptidivorans]|uniref:Ferrochelatase n=1 Tax=Natronincola peptidivorans TaxID=426128 RepID=A0A1H9Y6D0_9FIRM|nr:CbiX/SirB N-terminal domain-containing protein [Natronincola peptidivorans]SES64436.1 ferrochelatase [Natronincola peptidivorans]